ncbi:MAG TPA: hypothetical protein VI386_02820 [Candidatus Sulfotelmatobacter sp.]
MSRSKNYTWVKGSKTEIMAYLKGAFNYCDGVYSGLADAHLNDPADFWGTRTNKMFILTQVANPDASHCAISSRICASMASCLPGAGLTAQRRVFFQDRERIQAIVVGRPGE